MFVPLTPDQVEGAVKGAIEGTAEVATGVIKKWRANSSQKRWMAVATEQLNSMFANRRHAFRSLRLLATAFDDEEPYVLTRETLKKLMPETVRKNTSEKQSWVKENNWVWQVDEATRKRSIVKDANGLYVLEEGVPEGYL